MITYLTGKDFEHLSNELKQKELRIKELHVKLGEAAKKSGSYVNNNPEYMALKSQIDTLETVTSSIKNLLSKVEVKEIDDLDKNIVTNYSMVTVEDKDGEEFAYYIQIPFVVHKNKHAINASPESPVGKALLGAKIGDTIEINIPNNNKILKIKEIAKV